MMWAIYLLLPFIFGLVYWLRGGHLKQYVGTQIWKLVYGFLLALPVLIFGGGGALTIAIYVLTGLLCFLMVTIGHGSALDMGRRPDYADEGEIVYQFAKLFTDNPFLQDRVAVAFSGFLYGMPLMIGLPIVGAPIVWPAFAMALSISVCWGFLKSLSYVIAWERFEKKHPSYDPSLSPIPTAEFFTGFTQGAMITSIGIMTLII